MSLSYSFRCDICGTCIGVPIERPPEAVPDQWATLMIKHPSEPERTYKGHVCAICAKAIESGESLDIYRMRVAVARGEPVIVDLPDGGFADKSELVPVDLPKETFGVVNANEPENDVYGVSEEEASQ